MAPRPDPEPCREQDLGLFEITQRDGAARIGKLHTKHGMVTTPMLLPVINPNLRTIEPREMWDKYGIEALTREHSSRMSMEMWRLVQKR